jgi:hypothetical protein
MAFTLEQLEALEAAIAQGVKRVKYADKEVEYPSLKDMLMLRDQMREELGLIAPASKVKYADYNKGVYPYNPSSR